MTTVCRGCGKPIIWIRMHSGKKIPVDLEEVAYEQKAGGSLKIVTPNGEVLSAERPADPQKATGIGYISHFATCPKADAFRKREARPKKDTENGQQMSMMF